MELAPKLDDTHHTELLIGVVGGLDGSRSVLDAIISGTATWLTAEECMTDSCQPALAPSKFGLPAKGIFPMTTGTSILDILLTN